MNPLAKSLNEVIKENNPHILEMLSDIVQNCSEA